VSQIEETASLGADAVLLIARLLEKKLLHALVLKALEQGLDPVIEVNDEADIEKIPADVEAVIGINNRDLRTFKTEVNHALSLLSKLPPQRTIIRKRLQKCRGT